MNMENVVKPNEVKVGDFFIVKYDPWGQNRGIIMTNIVEVYHDYGFLYLNHGMGVEWKFKFDKPLIKLSDELQIPFSNDYVRRIGGIHIPREKESILKTLSQDRNYKRSLERHPMFQSKEELREILSEPYA